MCEYCNNTRSINNLPCPHCVGDLKSDEFKIELCEVNRYDVEFKNTLRNMFNPNEAMK